MKLLKDECMEMKAIDMWGRDVTRDGRVAAGKGNVGLEANRAVVASTRWRSAVRGQSCTHRAGRPRNCSVLPRRGCFARMRRVEKHRNERVY